MKNRSLREVYLKHLNSILDRYQKDIFNYNYIIAKKELVKDISIIISLLVSNRLKDISIILDDMPFKAYVEDMINYYLYDFKSNNNDIYDNNLRKYANTHIYLNNIINNLKILQLWESLI